jgi:hypothetical protein
MDQLMFSGKYGGDLADFILRELDVKTLDQV